MSASIVGLLLSIVFMGYMVTHAVSDLRVFNDIPGFLLICGSTVAVALMIYTGKDTGNIFKLMAKAFKSHKDTNVETTAEVINLVKESDGDVRRLEQLVSGIKHPFLREGIQLIIERFEPMHIDEIMNQRFKKTKEEHAYSVNSVSTLAKYPPAFGIMACVIGLISVMQKLGGDLGPGELAPSMAVALVGTLIGLITANYVIMPLGENLKVKADIDIRDRKIILAGVSMIARRESALLIQEKLNSHLPEDNRVDVLGVGGGAPAQKAG